MPSQATSSAAKKVHSRVSPYSLVSLKFQKRESEPTTVDNHELEDGAERVSTSARQNAAGTAALQDDAETYKLDFGKFIGKTFEDLDLMGELGYISFLIREGFHERVPRLKTGLELFLDKRRSRLLTHSSMNKSPEPSSSTNNSERTASNEGWNHVLIFGKHKGKKLSEVPQSYLSWLRENVFYRPDLRKALDAIPAIQADGLTPVDAIPSGSGVLSWRPPSLETAPNLFLEMGEDPLWILESEAKVLFRLDLVALAKLPKLRVIGDQSCGYTMCGTW